MKPNKTPFLIGTAVPGFGTIQAVKSTSAMRTRDYLLLDENGVTTWLDELAVTELLNELEKQ